MGRHACKQCGLDCKGKQKLKYAVVSRIEELSQITANDVEILDLVSAQEDDEDLATLKRWVSEGARPDSKHIHDRSFYLKSLWTQWDRLSIKDHSLMQKWDIIETVQILWQTIVPLKQRRVVLNYMISKFLVILGLRKPWGRSDSGSIGQVCIMMYRYMWLALKYVLKERVQEG